MLSTIIMLNTNIQIAEVSDDIVRMIFQPVGLQLLDSPVHGAVTTSKLVAAVDPALQHEPVEGGVEEDPVADQVADVEAGEGLVLVVGGAVLEHSIGIVELRTTLLTPEGTFQL